MTEASRSRKRDSGWDRIPTWLVTPIDHEPDALEFYVQAFDESDVRAIADRQGMSNARIERTRYDAPRRYAAIPLRDLPLRGWIATYVGGERKACVTYTEAAARARFRLYDPSPLATLEEVPLALRCLHEFGSRGQCSKPEGHTQPCTPSRSTARRVPVIPERGGSTA